MSQDGSTHLKKQSASSGALLPAGTEIIENSIESCKVYFRNAVADKPSS
jgi:hypothetical protein